MQFSNFLTALKFLELCFVSKILERHFAKQFRKYFFPVNTKKCWSLKVFFGLEILWLFFHWANLERVFLLSNLCDNKIVFQSITFLASFA